MIALTILASYVLIGMVSGRVLFIKSLSDSPRYRYERIYASRVIDDYSKVSLKKTTSEYNRAMKLSAFGGASWPIALPFYVFILAPTPTEKARAKEEKQKELEDRFRQLESEVLSFGKKL
jgi:hypothetical protein